MVPSQDGMLYRWLKSCHGIVTNTEKHIICRRKIAGLHIVNKYRVLTTFYGTDNIQ